MKSGCFFLHSDFRSFPPISTSAVAPFMFTMFWHSPSCCLCLQAFSPHLYTLIKIIFFNLISSCNLSVQKITMNSCFSVLSKATFLNLGLKTLHTSDRLLFPLYRWSTFESLTRVTQLVEELGFSAQAIWFQSLCSQALYYTTWPLLRAWCAELPCNCIYGSLDISQLHCSQRQSISLVCSDKAYT